MKECLCLEVERLGLSSVIMGSRGYGAVKHSRDGRLGSVSNYCVHHCVCLVVVVQYPDDKDDDNAGRAAAPVAVVAIKKDEEEEAVIKPVPTVKEHLNGKLISRYILLGSFLDEQHLTLAYGRKSEFVLITKGLTRFSLGISSSLSSVILMGSVKVRPNFEA